MLLQLDFVYCYSFVFNDFASQSHSCFFSSALFWKQFGISFYFPTEVGFAIFTASRNYGKFNIWWVCLSVCTGCVDTFPRPPKTWFCVNGKGLVVALRFNGNNQSSLKYSAEVGGLLRRQRFWLLVWKKEGRSLESANKKTFAMFQKSSKRSSKRFF